MQTLPGDQCGVLLALLWASLANVSPTAFWAVAFVLLPEHEQWRTKLSCEIAENLTVDASGFDSDPGMPPHQVGQHLPVMLRSSLFVTISPRPRMTVMLA
jgi:hypothetical protein